MKALGLNPGEQEMIDMTNEVSVNGLIYYPDFCKLVLRKYREENRETLNQALFKVGPGDNSCNIFVPESSSLLEISTYCTYLHSFVMLVLVGLVLKLRAAWWLPPPRYINLVLGFVNHQAQVCAINILHYLRSSAGRTLTPRTSVPRNTKSRRSFSRRRISS